MPTFELRKLYRADVVLKVEYQTLDEPVIIGMGYTKNMSSSGFSLINTDQLEKDVKLGVLIYFNDSGNVLKVQSKVLWQIECSHVPKSGNKYYVTGLKISHIIPSDALKQSEFIEKMVKDQSEERNIEVIEKLEND